VLTVPALEAGISIHIAQWINTSLVTCKEQYLAFTYLADKLLLRILRDLTKTKVRLTRGGVGRILLINCTGVALVPIESSATA
jgi:hypothetical protein